MKVPVNYADVRMEQLLQRIQTSYEMAKDAESKHRIIELLLSATDAIQNLTKDQIYPEMSAKRGGKKHIDIPSDGCLNRVYCGWLE